MSASTRRDLLRNVTPRKIFTFILLIVAISILFTIAPKLTLTRQLVVDDFVEYWSAGRLNLNGQNPYDPGLLKSLQISTGRTTEVPLMMWNPPWTLILVMPFGALDYYPARLLWMLMNILIVFACATLIWDTYGGPKNRRWIAWAAAFLFGPTIQAFKMGQIIPLLLLGVTGFLVFQKRQKYWLAGAFLALLAIKPHTLYLFLCAVFLWAVYQRKWNVIIAAGITGIFLTILSSITNPSLMGQYIYASTHYPPSDFASATIGAALRSIFGQDLFWMQFIPPLITILWMVVYWYKNRDQWEWEVQIALILLVSIATSAYGWTSDQLVLSLPVVAIAYCIYKNGWTNKLIPLLIPYLAVNILILTLYIQQLYFWWTSSFFLVSFLIANYLLTHKKQAKPHLSIAAS